MDALKKNDLISFSRLLHESWILKKDLSNSITNYKINQIYDEALKKGALGGKLLGAGGGGFYMFYCPKNRQKKLIKTLSKLKPLKIKFSNEGSKVIFNNIKL